MKKTSPAKTLRRKKTFSEIMDNQNVAGYIFISPFLFGLFAFTLIPIIISFFLSFTRYNILSAPEFIGFENYIRMFTDDPLVMKSFWVTMFYALISVPLKLIMALMVAILFYKGSRASAIYRGIYYLPSIMGSSIAVAVLWRRLFASDGVINGLLAYIGIDCHIGWLSRTDTAIWTLIILSVWQFGSSMLVFLGGLKQIPNSLYEAATVDGAGKVKQFFSITLPMLTPVILFNLIQQTINGFTIFTQGYVITNGAPLNSTLFYAVYLYRRSFEYYEMGFGSAMAWFMLLIVAILSSLIFKSSNRWVFKASDAS